jgi:hypothetical protein
VLGVCGQEYIMNGIVSISLNFLSSIFLVNKLNKSISKMLVNYATAAPY